MTRQIEELVDTGDLLFLECTCTQLLSEMQIRKCFLRKTIRSASKYFNKGYSTAQPWDGVALVYRNQEGPQVICDFHGIKHVRSYESFLSQPYISAIALRKLTTKDPIQGFVEEEFKDKALKLTESSWVEATDGVGIIKLYLKETGLASEETFSTVDELEKAALVAANKGKYSANIIVRTEDSKREIPNY